MNPLATQILNGILRSFVLMMLGALAHRGIQVGANWSEVLPAALASLIVIGWGALEKAMAAWLHENGIADWSEAFRIVVGRILDRLLGWIKKPGAAAEK